MLALMAAGSRARVTYTFGDCELDCRSRELRKHGRTLRVQQQPFEVLSLLVSAAGDVVTREELREHIWHRDTFVDFDRAINKAVNRLRQLLHDNAARPRFIETVPRRGYRFVAPVARASRTHVVERDVREMLLKARHFWNRRTVDDLNRSLEYFRLAIERDPECAAAWAGLADTYVMRGHFGVQQPSDAFSAARAAAERALALDADDPEAHTTLGEIHKLYEWNWDAAERCYVRAVEIDPEYAVAHHWYAQLLSVQARHDEALAEIEAARRCDPLSVPVNAFVAYVWFEARQYDRAIAAAEQARELDANAPLPHLLLGRIYAKCNELDKAIAASRTASHLAGAAVPLIDAVLGYATARAGDRAEAEGILDRLRTARFGAQASSMELALVQLGLGDTDAAIAALEEAYRTRSLRMPAICDPLYSELAGERRYRELVARLRLPLRV
jgi:DNA-binding winged helix-turn-helix (wHTH) protein/tetratricopeptide (TPR) repeat protein